MKKTILSIVAAAAFAGSAGTAVQAEEVTIQKGDTLWSLSKIHSVTVEDIQEWNGLSSDLIIAGDVLEINPEEAYKVAEGDTLWGIAQQFNVSVDQLKQWNNISADVIKPGQELVIYPQGGTAAKVSAPKAAETAGSQAKAASAAPAAKPAAAEKTTAAPVESKKVMTMEATAYTASCEGCSGITATGINLKDNPNQKVISVDPSVIPLGTKVHVEGYGEAIAGDTGGAIKGNKIDVFIPNKQDAIQFGRKTVKVTILD